MTTGPRPRPPAGPSTPKPKPGPKTPEEMLPVSLLAQRWHCSKDHIYDLIARGELRTVPLGIGRAKTRIPESAVAEFVAKRTSKARAA